MTDERLRARVRSAGFVLCAAIGAMAAHAQAPPAGAPVALLEAQPQSASHGAQERIVYHVDIADSEPRLLRVEQRGLDLIVSVERPDGRSESFSSPLFRDGSEAVVLDAGPGRYRVEVRSDEHTGAAGGHSATLLRLPAGTSASELEAWRAMSAGAAASAVGGEDGWQQAASDYARAAQLWGELGRAREQADAAFSVATLRYWYLFEWGAAVERAAAAAALYDTLGEAALAANARHLQGAALVEQALEAQQSSTAVEISPESQALFAAALELLEEARAAHEQAGNVYELGRVLNNFGYTHYGKGELERARGYYVQAATLQQSVGEWSAQAQALGNIAVLDAEAGELVSARDSFTRIVELLPPTRALDRANALDNLAAVQRMLGELERALQTSTEALDLQRRIEDDQGVGRSLRRIGETYFELGDFALAAEQLQQALPIAERTSDGRNREAVLRSLGNVAFAERDYAAALDHHRRALQTAASATDRAYLHLAIAKDLAALGRAAESLAAAEAAESEAQSSGSELLRASALGAAGRARAAAGDAGAATADLERALAIFDRLGLHAERAEALHGLALAARAAGDIERALEHGAAALTQLEGLRARILDPQLRALFAGARRDYYETQIDLLMARAARPGASPSDLAPRALEVSERGRARMIAELVHDAAARAPLAADEETARREAALYLQLAERRYQRDQLIAAAAPAAQIQQAVGELAALENALNVIEIERRRADPKYSSLTAPEPLGANEMQALLDPDTVLLQYSLGAEASYVFAVTSDDVAAFALADRATIEAAALRALDELKAFSRPTGAVASPALSDLAALVLAPAAAYLDRPRVLLALDGALQYVPFATLPLPQADGAAALLATHEVVEVPSLSVLARSGAERRAPAPQTLAVFADPVLQPSDPRFGGLQPSLAELSIASGLAARASASPLGRLLSTEYEGRVIASLVSSEQRLLASGFAANRAAVLDGALQDFRYIHFATHGVVDARYPALSALLLSQFDGRGNPQDGFLRLRDIYGLHLDADLVVLSACDTALGREVRGEGLLGLAHGFLSAGARRLVASLWQVPDRATAELMTKFYEHMLTDGLRPAEALRKAQMWSASQRRYQHPYYWGGFVLLGDWR